jgi:hypothetical protein
MPMTPLLTQPPAALPRINAIGPLRTTGQAVGVVHITISRDPALILFTTGGCRLSTDTEPPTGNQKES